MRLQLKEKNNNFTELKLNYKLKLLTETKVFPYSITVRLLFLSSLNALCSKDPSFSSLMITK